MGILYTDKNGNINTIAQQLDYGLLNKANLVTCSTAGAEPIKVLSSFDRDPALYERITVIFDNDNTADDVQFQIGNVIADAYVEKFQAGTGAFSSGVPYEFVYDGAKFRCVNSDTVIKKRIEDEYGWWMVLCFGDGLKIQCRKRTVRATVNEELIYFPVSFSDDKYFMLSSTGDARFDHTLFSALKIFGHPRDNTSAWMTALFTSSGYGTAPVVYSAVFIGF